MRDIGLKVPFSQGVSGSLVKSTYSSRRNPSRTDTYITMQSPILEEEPNGFGCCLNGSQGQQQTDVLYVL